jgi:UrcA family protein
MANPRTAALTLAVMASVALVSPAHAGERTKRVQHSDLDLSTVQGQETFKARVLRAVRSVCSQPTARVAFERLDRQRCEAKSRATAMRKAEQTIARHGGNVKVALDY